MPIFFLRKSLPAVLITMLLAWFSVPALADKDPVYTGVFSSTALSGYDPVAYFTQGKPVKGAKKIQHAT